MPPCLTSSHCLALTAAWSGTVGAFACLLTHARDSYAPLKPIMYRGARMTLWIAYRSAGYGRMEPVCFGRAARWPCLNPEMDHAHATLHVFLPLLESDRGVVWHHRCVYMPLNYSH